MSYNVALGVNWQGKPDFKRLIQRAKAADAAGVHSIWVAEALVLEPACCTTAVA